MKNVFRLLREILMEIHSLFLIKVTLLSTYPINLACFIHGSSVQNSVRLRSRCYMSVSWSTGMTRSRPSSQCLQNIGRIHLLAKEGLRSLVSCWLSAKSYCQHLKAILRVPSIFVVEKSPLLKSLSYFKYLKSSTIS